MISNNATEVSILILKKILKTQYIDEDKRLSLLNYSVVIFNYKLKISSGNSAPAGTTQQVSEFKEKNCLQLYKKIFLCLSDK